MSDDLNGDSSRQQLIMTGDASELDAFNRWRQSNAKSGIQYDQRHTLTRAPQQLQIDDTGAAGQLKQDQRVKSKSQTTIHYEQSQDPFKAVPFNYLGSGNLSMNNPQQQQHLRQHQQVVVMAPQMNGYPTVMNGNEQFEANQLVPNSAGWRPANNQQVNNQMYQQQPQQQQLIDSQFDPQNSRQLIDLIQQKHHQQLASASQTVASLEHQQQSQQMWAQQIGSVPKLDPLPPPNPQTANLRHKW